MANKDGTPKASATAAGSAVSANAVATKPAAGTSGVYDTTTTLLPVK
ncbi:hypothetical protein [Planktothrix agardhii]|nr:hypothetical protein [Planktothrix agardhii]MCF3578721.1 hypothetical protein [Planktothrix agardhii 1812]